jgi:hypothetical protein
LPCEAFVDGASATRTIRDGTLRLDPPGIELVGPFA